MELDIDNQNAALVTLPRKFHAVVKSFFPIFALALLACGCVEVHREQLALEAVGPAPQNPAISSSIGELQVYSALQAGYVQDRYGDMREEIVQQFSPYKIFRADGEPVLSVDNDRKSGVLEPEVARLAPGTYCVKARARGYGRVSVPVIIKSGERTVVHLEGGQMWPDKSVFNASNAVFLPNGTIVGWKAQSAPLL